MKKITSMILALVFAVSVIGSASAKTLKMQGREYSSSNTVSLHNTYYWDGSASSQVRRPSLIITSIG